MIKILLYQNGTSGGGSKQSLFEIARALHLSSDFELSILVTNKGWFSSALDKAAIPYCYQQGLEQLSQLNNGVLKKSPVTFCVKLLQSVPAYLRVWKRAFSFGPDIVVLSEAPREIGEFLPYLVFPLVKVVVISQIENELDYRGSRFVCSRASSIFCASEAVRAHFTERGYPVSKLKVTPLIVEPQVQGKNEPSSKVKFPWSNSNGEVIIGHVGAIHPRKGTIELLNVFQEISTLCPQVRLVHAGACHALDPETISYTQKVKALADSPALKSVVYFAGWCDEVESIMRRFYFLVLPTTREGLSRVSVQALALGVPIISYDLASMREVVEDGVSGYLVSPGDTKALKEKMLYLINSPDVRNAMSKASTVLWEYKFSPQKTRGVTLQAFKDVYHAHLLSNDNAKSS